MSINFFRLFSAPSRSFDEKNQLRSPTHHFINKTCSVVFGAPLVYFCSKFHHVIRSQKLLVKVDLLSMARKRESSHLKCFIKPYLL